LPIMTTEREEMQVARLLKTFQSGWHGE
jgi:hypothetical protein